MSALLPPLQPVDLATVSPLSSYLDSIRAVCPFVEPAVKTGRLYFCEITPDCQTEAEIHPRIFEQMVPIIERFRDDRQLLLEQQQRLLICHTVVIHLPSQLDAPATRLLAWPNWLGWLLKQIYTPKEIVLGFVRKNVPEKSQLGHSVPAAPFHAIVIRSRVVNSDHRFFPGNQQLLQAMMQADDDGQNAHTGLIENIPDLRDPQALREANYYQRLRLWGQTQLAGKPQQR
jgi:hypothetical protein